MITTSAYFKFKGKYSYEYDILAEELPPITRPAKRVNVFTAPGANGNYHVDEGSYESVVKTVQCAVKNERYIDEISYWLQGSGDVIFSNDNEYYYKAFISNQIPFSQVFRKWITRPFRFPVVFDCQPVKHSVNYKDHKLTVENTPFKVLSYGTVIAKPLITVYGAGDITLTVNDTSIGLRSVNEYIAIDSEIQECYKDGTNTNNQMAGEFPGLSPAGIENTISFTGNVNKIDIVPRWGWL